MSNSGSDESSSSDDSDSDKASDESPASPKVGGDGESRASWEDKNGQFASEVDRVIGVVQEQATGRLRIPSRGSSASSDESPGSRHSYLSDLSLVEVGGAKKTGAGVSGIVMNDQRAMALTEFSSASESDDDDDDVVVGGVGREEEDSEEDSDSEEDDAFMRRRR